MEDIMHIYVGVYIGLETSQITGIARRRGRAHVKTNSLRWTAPLLNLIT